MKLRYGLPLSLLAIAGVAHAEVRQSAADGFLVVLSEPVAATPAKAWAALVQPQRWWSDEHTWSGKAANLSLKPEAGGCFCERWTGGSVEHGRVVMALPPQLLRLEAALGPLQEFALKGVLTFRIDSGDDGATTLALEYRVNGASASGLDAFAPQVDEVLGQQFARLVRFVANGNPDAPPPVAPPAVDAGAARRAGIMEEWKKSAEEQAAADKAAARARKDAPANKR
ncbi:SRPBCC domain-containing protein [Dokdonella sp.]|uniref:SRPBCC domain-containing protein n=1 Tax=Dokdonella sp. TaxID=2291710 RepID=UPI00378302A6